MKLIQWNCQCSFRTKNERILRFSPDILVVCECENEERLQFGEKTPKPTDFVWFGELPHKGIGVFSYSDWKFEVIPEYNSEFKFVIPLRAFNNDDSMFLLAVWTQGEKNSRYRYIDHVWCALEYYKQMLGEHTLIIGDFNSNVQWDKNPYIGNHTQVVKKLSEIGIHSLYHQSRNIPQGNEPEPTFFLYRHETKPYHIDYCFAHEKLISDKFGVTVGEHKDWSDISDHVPLIIDL